jgi:4-hydroxy-3-polyprenylbenzoate decarboxylase
MSNIVVAITGASGAAYAVRLLEVLLAAGRKVDLTISPSGAVVLAEELGLKVDLQNFAPLQLLGSTLPSPGDSALGTMTQSSESSFDTSSIFSDVDATPGKLFYHHYQDFNAGIASGSRLTAGMVICPCSMGTLAAVSQGLSQNLIHRAADVHLKERRKLIVVPRETPLGSIQLENMKRLADAGAVVLPAMPGFYHGPLTIHDLIDFIVGRICDQLGVAHNLCKRWGEQEG